VHNEVKGSMFRQMIASGTAAAMSANMFVRDACTFAGWNVPLPGLKQFNFSFCV
jgi:hypothetical protein